MRYIFIAIIAIVFFTAAAQAQTPSNDLIVKKQVEYHGQRWPFNGFDSRIVRQYVLDQLSMEQVNDHWDIFPEEDFGFWATRSKEEREDLEALKRAGYWLTFKLRWAEDSGTNRSSSSSSSGYYYPSRNIFGQPVARRRVTSSSSSSTTDKVIGGSAWLTYTLWNRSNGSVSRTVKVQGRELVETSSRYSSSFDGFSYSRATSRSSSWAQAEIEDRLAYAIAYELILSLKGVWAELPHDDHIVAGQPALAEASPTYAPQTGSGVATIGEVSAPLTPREVAKARKAKTILLVWTDAAGRQQKMTVTNFEVRLINGQPHLVLQPPGPMPEEVEVHYR